MRLKRDVTAKDSPRHKVVIRSPRRSDVDDLLAQINSLVDEEAEILANKRMTRKEEVKWLDGELESIRKGKTIALVAEVDGRVVAHADITKHGFRSSHVGTLGIAVSKGFRDIGLGTRLVSALLEAAAEAGLRVVILEVFAGNNRAIHVYSKLGFRETGRYPGKISYKGGYVDSIIMVTEVEKRRSKAQGTKSKDNSRSNP